jgi:hypothetical protein
LISSKEILKKLKIKKILKKPPQTCSRLQILFLTIGRESGYRQGSIQKKTLRCPPSKTSENKKINGIKNTGGLLSERIS